MISPENSLLLLIDLQERLMPAIRRADQIIANTRRLVLGANELGVRVAATEQYPQGLGPTVAAITEVFSEDVRPLPKKSFSCLGCPEFSDRIDGEHYQNILLCGVETHVCVLQTALDFLEREKTVFLPTDALGSRFLTDHETALRRLEQAGAVLTTTETTLFEWCRTADNPAFKTISRLVKERTDAPI